MGSGKAKREAIKALASEAGLWDALKASEDGLLYEPCPAEGCAGEIVVNPAEDTARCKDCGHDGTAMEFFNGRIAARRKPTAAPTGAVIRPSAFLPPNVPPETAACNAPETVPDASPDPLPAETRASAGERWLIGLLALVLLGAGLAAGALSGFANYQAFSAMVDNRVQARVWGWSGVIASVVSLAGFTFVYWHAAGKRRVEAARALVFALAGAATSLAGTALFMQGRAAERVAHASGLEARRATIERQVEDWRVQLGAIPPETRSVEGLEAYLRGVEAAGRAHQKPYRDAQNELGQARRRASLEARVEAARAELATLAPAAAAAGAEAATEVPAWFFALMLEVFSSQGSSIGLVALLILAGRRGGR